MAFDPTPAQKNAIEAQGHILVSAAAGSGKTAVLVERIIQKLLDKNHPMDIDKLLVVTFTNSAAAEMRARIEKRLHEEVQKNKGNRHLLRQQMLLSNAKICTIDSFCIDYARQYFYELGIDPGFKVFDPQATEAVLQKLASNLLWQQYESPDEAFDSMLFVLGSEYGEKQIQDLMIRVYRFTRSLPDPSWWLQDAIKAYDNETFDLWTIGLFSATQKRFQSLPEQIRGVREHLQLYPGITEKFDPFFAAAQDQVRQILSAADQQDWDGVYAHSHSFTQNITLRGKFPEEALKEEIARVRGELTDAFDEVRSWFAMSYAEEKALMQDIAPIIKKLIGLVIALQDAFSAEMRKRGQFTFDEIEHMVLSILQKQAMSAESTQSANSVLFAEVLVDEYQDVNDLQNALFFALSDGGKHLFMVGDAKQSIYGFRNANPANFIDRKDQLPLYSPGVERSKIILSNNFRSRAGICAYINQLFTVIMKKDNAQIEYNEEEILKPTAIFAEYPECEAELHLLDLAKSEENRVRSEARYLAGYIKQMLDRPPFLRDKKDPSVLRKAQPEDFAILLRALDGKTGVYLEEFQKQGIPVATDSGNFFETSEIMLMTSVLKAVDNPTKDIPLLSSLLSPVFGFSPDRLAFLRGEYKNATLIGTISAAAQDGHADCSRFLEQLHSLRTLAVTLSPAKLLAAVYRKYSLIEIVSAMPDGERRKANLQLLISYAEGYMDLSEGGLSAFIRYLDTLQENGKVKSIVASSDHAVKIMSIHASKGLQFPITILAYCSGMFNKRDVSDKVVLDDKLLLGAKYIDKQSGVRYSTLARRAIAKKELARNIAEEMRLLYVALTRAEEKLVLLVSEKNLQTKIEKISELPAGSNISANAYTDWILYAAMQHNATKNSLLTAQDPDENIAELIKVVWAQPEDVLPLPDPKELQTAQQQIDPVLYDTLKERFSYIYPFTALRNIQAKVTVTELVEKLQTKPIGDFTKRPAFLSKKGLTPAERGTATHKFLQYTDFVSAQKDAEAELERLVEYEYLTEKEGQAIDLHAIKMFFSGSVYHRIMQAERYEKEKSFIVSVALSELAQEKTLVQGIADCVFYEEGCPVILDFKTDRVSTMDELLARYKEQLVFYAKAIEQIEARPVKECIIYSLHLHKSISFNLQNGE